MIMLGIIVLCYMLMFFAVGTYLKRNDIVDIAWGPGFALLALYALATGTLSPAAWIITFCVITWASRLATHIALRMRGKDEDYRYAAWRRAWGTWVVIRSLFQVYLLQGALMLVVALPIITAATQTTWHLAPLLIGLAVWTVGFFVEVIADWQLSLFLADPAHRGQILDTGLWAHSRHPNYFGEALLWWGIWVMSLPNSLWLLGICGPITITLLLRYVSGVPLLEQALQKNPGFAAYAQRVPIFIPCWRR